MRLVQDAAEFMHSAPQFYQNMENRTNKSFYHPTPIRHIFADHAEVNQWQEKSTLPLFDNLLGDISTINTPSLPAPYGSGILNECGWLDTINFLNAHREAYEKEDGQLIHQALDKTELQELSTQYQATVICTGHLMRLMFPELDLFRPTRGELMTIKTEEIPEDFIIHGKVFIMPLGNQVFKVGATYHWDELDDQGTSDGLSQLKTGLEKLFKGPYEVISHQAGVRPNVKDRKPLLGKIEGDNIYSFNGMGSRAVLMTPSLADYLLDHILNGTDIPTIYSLKRYIK